MHLQKVAVCFGGRALAGTLLHLAATGTFSGMPDNTIIRSGLGLGLRLGLVLGSGLGVGLGSGLVPG